MKYVIIVLVAVFGVVLSISPLLTSCYLEPKSPKHNQLNFTEDQLEKCSQTFPIFVLNGNQEDVTNKGNLERPCDFEDLNCIREFLSKNSKCCPKYGPLPDPLCYPQNTLIVARTNMTFLLTNLIITGLKNSRLIEFYYNKKTKNVVMAIEIKNMNQTTPKGIFSYQRTGKESIVLSDYGTIIFKSQVITAVIPNMPDLDLGMAEIHVDVPNGRPDYYYGPNARSCEPDVREAYEDFVKSFPTFIREGLIYQSQLFAVIFIQNLLCDFGIKLCSV